MQIKRCDRVEFVIRLGCLKKESTRRKPKPHLKTQRNTSEHNTPKLHTKTQQKHIKTQQNISNIPTPHIKHNTIQYGTTQLIKIKHITKRRRDAVLHRLFVLQNVIIKRRWYLFHLCHSPAITVLWNSSILFTKRELWIMPKLHMWNKVTIFSVRWLHIYF